MEDEDEILENMRFDLLDMDVKVSNVISTFNVGPGLFLDLDALVMRGINMEYNGGQKLRYKIRDPAVCATIFSSGKVMMMGTISEKEARLASRKVARTLQKLITSYSGEVCKLDKHFSVQNMRVRHFKVVNFWASTRLPWNVKLLSFAQINKECQYEPELSPNITYQIKEPKATVKIHASGSLVMQAPVLDNIHSAIRDVYRRAWLSKTMRPKMKEDRVEPNLNGMKRHR